MPEINLNGLQYVEDNELKQAWKSSRRERIKQQEEKIWEEFIQEQDIVHSVCESDPYQFIEQLPDTYLQELLCERLNKKQENDMRDDEEQSEFPIDPTDSVPARDHCADEAEDGHNVLHIFHDEVDSEELSGTEGEALDESGGSPCTVREKEEAEEKPPDPQQVTEKVSIRSSENIASVIENSIYCAKVKDLRVKINEELLSIMTSLERLDLSNEDPEDLRKMLKRSAEFCSRFNRIHLYQLQRQVKDAERGCGVSGAAAAGGGRHTQLQAQLLRLTSLHHNVLQALCMVGGAAGAGRDVTALLRALPAPQRAQALYADELLATCDKLDEALERHSVMMADVVRRLEEPDKNPYAKPSQARGQKRPSASSNKSPAKTASRADGSLSMYSLDTHRLSLRGKSSSARVNQASGTLKARGSAGRAPKKLATPKSQTKSPVRRRGRRDAEVPTLVQTVATCASSRTSLARAAPNSGRGEARPTLAKGRSPEASRRSSGTCSPRSPTAKGNGGRSGPPPTGRSPTVTTVEKRSHRTPTTVSARNLMYEWCGRVSPSHSRRQVGTGRRKRWLSASRPRHT
ncbi:unnamed protein product, partial [Iphiclides podalirius]